MKLNRYSELFSWMFRIKLNLVKELVKLSLLGKMLFSRSLFCGFVTLSLINAAQACMWSRFWQQCAVMCWLKRIDSAKQVFIKRMLVEKASLLERVPADLSLDCSICWFYRARVIGFVQLSCWCISFTFLCSTQSLGFPVLLSDYSV